MYIQSIGNCQWFSGSALEVHRRYTAYISVQSIYGRLFRSIRNSEQEYLIPVFYQPAMDKVHSYPGNSGSADQQMQHHHQSLNNCCHLNLGRTAVSCKEAVLPH